MDVCISKFGYIYVSYISYKIVLWAWTVNQWVPPYLDICMTSTGHHCDNMMLISLMVILLLLCCSHDLTGYILCIIVVECVYYSRMCLYVSVCVGYMAYIDVYLCMCLCMCYKRYKIVTVSKTRSSQCGGSRLPL